MPQLYENNRIYYADDNADVVYRNNLSVAGPAGRVRRATYCERASSFWRRHDFPIEGSTNFHLYSIHQFKGGRGCNGRGRQW